MACNIGCECEHFDLRQMVFELNRNVPVCSVKSVVISTTMANDRVISLVLPESKICVASVPCDYYHSSFIRRLCVCKKHFEKIEEPIYTSVYMHIIEN